MGSAIVLLLENAIPGFGDVGNIGTAGSDAHVSVLVGDDYGCDDACVLDSDTVVFTVTVIVLLAMRFSFRLWWNWLWSSCL